MRTDTSFDFRRLALWAGGAALLCAGACEDGPSTRVQYVSAEPLGKWYKDDSEGKPSGGSRAMTMAMEMAASGGAKASSPAQQAGSAPAAPSGGAGGTGGTGGAGTSSAGKLASGGSGAGSDAMSDESGVTVAFTTVTQHMGAGGTSCKVGEDGMSYGPCNVGAIWVAKPDGTLVKVLAAWGGVYSKHLIRYKRALGSLRPDVKTTATLKMNAPHSATWDHTDLMQRALPPGPYKLLAEVADFDTMKVEGKENALLELELDTQKRSAPRVMDMPFYTDIELRYP